MNRPILCFLLFFFIQCSTSIDNYSIHDFPEWFINSTDHEINSLSHLNPGKIDSLVASFRKRCKTGSFTEVLNDTNGIPYVLGYKTPDKINPDTTYPLIIYLHGGTGTDLATKGESAYQMLSPLGDSMHLFLASPSSNKHSRWWSATGLSRILQTLRFMTLHYPIDPSKIFLAGVSDGATGCWAAANTINGPFAGFFAISGFGGLLPMAGMQLYPKNLMQRPIYNVNAGKDRLYKIETVDRFLDYMEENGVQLLRKTYHDQLHGFDYRDMEFGTLLKLIRSWSRPAYPTLLWNVVEDFPNISENLLYYRTDGTKDQPSINAWISKDTLVINSTAVQSFGIVLPAASIIKLAMRDGRPVRHFRKITDKNQIFKAMKHTCFPASIKKDLFDIAL